MLRGSDSPLPILRFRGTILPLPGLILALAFCGLHAKPLLSQEPTTTVLELSRTTVPAELPVTLTATVTSNGKALTRGQVVFCNASATFCEDLAVLGTAQLTSNGTARIKLLLSLGRHDIYAKFKGTRGTTS
jgi:hypothetical protein